MRTDRYLSDENKAFFMDKYNQNRLEECTDEKLNFIECPECGDDSFDSSRGVAMHYAYNHEGSLKYLFRCKECGRLKFGNGQKNTFCSKWCEIHSKTETFKHFDEDYLREQVEEQGKTVTEIADGLGVGMETVSKWVLEYEIGNEYECPSCDKKFSSLRGRNAHHTQVHKESIAGTKYECIVCDKNFHDNRSEEHEHTPKFCSMQCRGEYISGDSNPNKNAERRKKISQGLVDAYAEGRRKPKGRQTIVVEETGNKVDSGWEAEVDKLLFDLEIEYEYNGHGEFKRYEINDFTHAPDFIIPTEDKDLIVEVKGRRSVYEQEEKMETIANNLTQRKDVTYIIYGDVDLECDYHVAYGKEEELAQLI